jgi:hypothetical protein
LLGLVLALVAACAISLRGWAPVRVGDETASASLPACA